MRESGINAEGFEDCIPSHFSPEWRSMCARAIRAVAILGYEDAKFPATSIVQQQLDDIWKTSLRLLEAISSEVAADRSRLVA